MIRPDFVKVVFDMMSHEAQGAEFYQFVDHYWRSRQARTRLYEFRDRLTAFLQLHGSLEFLMRTHDWEGYDYHGLKLSETLTQELIDILYLYESDVAKFGEKEEPSDMWVRVELTLDNLPKLIGSIHPPSFFAVLLEVEQYERQLLSQAIPPIEQPVLVKKV